MYHQRKVSTGFKEELNGILYKNVENENMCIINARLAQDLRRELNGRCIKRFCQCVTSNFQRTSLDVSPSCDYKITSRELFSLRALLQAMQQNK